MAIFTKQGFERIAQSKAQNRLSTVLNETRKFSKTLANTSVFLSHSHKNRSIVEQAKVFLENLGLSIYVDWADETMPEKTNGTTAAKIKSKIRDNDKFILVATNDAVISKWCNWELGLGDASKFNVNKVCVLPIADNREDWMGNEYLQIYPRVEESEIISDYYKVVYPDGQSIPLNDWLRK